MRSAHQQMLHTQQKSINKIDTILIQDIIVNMFETFEQSDLIVNYGRN